LEDGSFELACVAYEWHLRNSETAFVLTDDGMLSYSAAAAFPECRVFNFDEMLAMFPDGAQLIDRALLNLSRLVKHPMDTIHRERGDFAFLLFCPERSFVVELRAMERMGLIEVGGASGDSAKVRITPEGWQHINELSISGPESQGAFVAMWFDESTNLAYRQAIKPAVEDAGFEPVRIDLKEHNNKICDEIVAEIRKSRFMIADFTGQRGGVYFEAGFAQGLGLPVIWIVHKDEVDHLHFDTRQYNHIVYTDAQDLHDQLYNRIAATIR
jgi:hypothetical protein